MVNIMVLSRLSGVRRDGFNVFIDGSGVGTLPLLSGTLFSLFGALSAAILFLVCLFVEQIAKVNFF